MLSPRLKELEKRINAFQNKIESQKPFEYTCPFLYPKQFAAIFDEHRYSIIMASTKSGKTHGCIVWLSDGAITDKIESNNWWVAPSHDQAEIAYRRSKRHLD